MLLIFAQTVSAQTTTQTLLQHDNRNLTTNIYPYQNPPPEEPYRFEDFLHNLHGSYAVSFMGPRLTGDSNSTYNIYVRDVAPIQLFHTFQLGYQVNSDVQIGFEEDILHNLVDGVKGNTGIVRNHSFESYDYSS